MVKLIVGLSGAAELVLFLVQLFSAERMLRASFGEALGVVIRPLFDLVKKLGALFSCCS